VLWACTLLGEWDFLIQYISTDFDTFYFNNIRNFLSKFGSLIDDYEIKSSVERLKLQHGVPEYNHLINEIKLPENKNSPFTHVQPSMNDRKLLHALSRNARASFQELGQKINESLETTRNHFNRLVKEGVLQGFTVNFDSSKIGYVDYLVFCRFHNFEKDQDFKMLVNNKAEIKLALRNGNVPEIYLLVSTRSPYEMESLVKEIKEKFYSNIHEIKHLTITQDIKLDLFPEGLIR
jgi:Lrp/AsnC family leucine-responsive transcriptional regulator